MRVERRPVDVIVAAVNALKVKSCWIDARPGGQCARIDREGSPPG
jgi:hypothetical protein